MKKSPRLGKGFKDVPELVTTLSWLVDVKDFMRRDLLGEQLFHEVNASLLLLLLVAAKNCEWQGDFCPAANFSGAGHRYSEVARFFHEVGTVEGLVHVDCSNSVWPAPAEGPPNNGDIAECG